MKCQDIHKITGTPNVATVTISFVTYICPSIRLTASLSDRNEQHGCSLDIFS